MMFYTWLFLATVVAVASGQSSSSSSSDMSTFVSGVEGWTMIGSTGSRLGEDVAFIGDFNKDGFDDVAVRAGSSLLLVMGSGGPWEGMRIDTFVSGIKGQKIFQVSSAQAFGDAVAAAGDINGDEYADVLVGSMYADATGRENCGAVHVIFGGPGPFQDLFLATLYESGKGFTIYGPYANANLGQSGHTVRGSVGDINNDGLDDFALSLPSFNSYAGAVWVIFGKVANYSNIDLANFGSSGAFLNGIPGESFGSSLDGAGDVNGDSIPDLIVGAISSYGLAHQSNAGRAYVILGGPSFASRDMSTFASSSDVLLFVPSVRQSYAGSAVLGAGDMNGDGIDDFVIGASAYVNSQVEWAGRVFVIYGTSALPSSAVILTTPFTGMAGYTAYHPSHGAAFGKALCRAGDINSDGYQDIVAGSVSSAFILFGGASPPQADIIVTSSTAVWTFSVPISNPHFGAALDGGHDFSGDGVPDLLFGAASQNTALGVYGGAVYFVAGPFNVNPTSAPTIMPSFSPSATPSTSTPSFVPSAAPTHVCVKWILGEFGETCATTCSAAQPSRQCKDSYFEDLLTSEAFELMVSSAVDGRSLGSVGSALSFCNGGVIEWNDQGAPSAVNSVLHADAGDTIRTFCRRPTEAASVSHACSALSSGFPSRQFCPCIHESCDVSPWFLGYSGDSCTTTCEHVGRVCDLEAVSSISDRAAFSAMVATATAVDNNYAVGSEEQFCTASNAPQFELHYPAVVTINVAGNMNQTFCSYPTNAAGGTSDPCGAAISPFRAQRFCPCKYGRRLDSIDEVVAPPMKGSSGGSLTSKIIAALPYLRGANL